jgi:ubiquitin-protein ligase E3 C
LIEDKIPELDEEKSVAMNPVSEAIMEMLLRPLKLVDSSNQELSDKILASFTYHILSIEFVDAIKYFIIPALAESSDFPYLVLLNFLCENYRKQVDLQNTILIDIEDEPTDKKGKDCDERVAPIYSSFLLYSILRLDQNHLGEEGDWMFFFFLF